MDNNFPPIQDDQAVASPGNNSILDENDLDVNIPNGDTDFSNFEQNQSMQKVQKMVVSLPAEASDSDLIEKEWVNVLQSIVSHTSEDPFTQQSEISKIKADYMKKRYNKDVKQEGQ